MTYWVAIESSFLESVRGTYSQTGFFVMTTPAACVPESLGISSSAAAVSTTFLNRSSPSYISRSCFDVSSAFAIVILSSLGTALASSFSSANVSERTFDTLRMAFFAFSVLKVTI